MAMRLTPEQIRNLRAENAKARARDFAAAQGLTEAELVAAYLGHGTTAIASHPDAIMPFVKDMGEVMALTRNESCVHERVGTYSNYHSGEVAAMVLDPEIDLRFFPAHWVHAFAVIEQLEAGPRRSIQVFDAAGDAVHKIYLRENSNTSVFDLMVESLALPAQSPQLTLLPRKETEAAKGDADKREALRKAWSEMTDTHQFFGMTKALGFNRLGANRVVGAPYAMPLPLDSVTRTLEQAASRKVPVMIFVGNNGCIQIHGGPIEKIVPMGPWINVLDPRFDMHLRSDHIAEVWLVRKMSPTGEAISVEAFDKEGMLILQIFGYRKDNDGSAWNALALGLLQAEEALA